MPGTPRNKARSIPAMRPPSYVNVPTQIAYASIPDALLITMVRILGLCWTNGYRHTPPLTYKELARLLNRPRSTLQRHLEILELELGWLRCERRDRRLVLHPRPPFAEPARALEPSGNGQNCARGASVAVEHRDRGNGAGHGTAVAVKERDVGYAGHGTAVAMESRDRGQPNLHETLARRQDLIEALAGVGIENPARERIAMDPTVEVDWIAAWQLWAKHPDRASLSNLPGYIVERLRQRERPPEYYLRLVRLTPAEEARLRRSRWDGGPDLDPDLQEIQPLYLMLLEERG